jgi:MFS family permease
MASTTSGSAKAALSAGMGFVVAASTAGTTFEWYDFFVFVPLAGILAKFFFAGLNDAAAYVFALGSFAVGFAFRPVGALIFGRLGDRIGRKGAFMITILMMGGATFGVGLLPGYTQVGLAAPLAFILLRIIQGIALGGEWGGAAVYIAEHSPRTQRGLMTSWIGAAAAFGLLGALVVTLVTRKSLGETAFAAWGWRIPFLISVFLVGASAYFRLKLAESPAFVKMQASGQRSNQPYVDSFLKWPSLKLVLIALFGVMVAQGAVWYCTFFYAQAFLEKTLKMAPDSVNGIMIALVVLSAPLYILFGWLSDRIGRKTVMIAGMLLFTLAAWPGFHLLAKAANPGLTAASAASPVTVVASPADCSLQFDPVGKAQFKTSCDILKSTLTESGVGYRNQASEAGTLAYATVGNARVASADGRGLAAPALKTLKAGVSGKLKAALTAAGYPAKADPAKVNTVLIFAILFTLATGACALYGPQAACLVELFPTRVRYTALSLPYHIGTGWVGGFLPTTAYAMAVGSGNLFQGVWYPIVGASISILVALLFLPETKGRDLDTMGA